MYQLLTVLMNYKRTVEDFRKCGPKAGTVYNLPYISDCVGGDVGRGLSCPELSSPVPCGDGACHANYISCLRSLGDRVEALVAGTGALQPPGDGGGGQNEDARLTYGFNDKGKVVS